MHYNWSKDMQIYSDKASDLYSYRAAHLKMGFAYILGLPVYDITLK